MSKERFQRTGMNSFYGEFFCDAVVPKDDFLRMLGQVVPWQRFTYRLVKYYKGKARTGRPQIDPSVVPRTGHKPSLDERYMIERKFGEAKQYHGLSKGCRLPRFLGIE